MNWSSYGKIALESLLALVTLASITALGAWLWQRRKAKKEAAAAKKEQEDAQKDKADDAKGKKDGKDPKDPKGQRPLTPEEEERQRAATAKKGRLRVAFARELRRLKENSTGRDHRYRVPWCLILGGPGGGQSTVMKHTGLHVPFAGEDEASAAEAGCRFHFFDKGLVLDVAGVGLADEDYFQTLLGLLRKERPRRPIDSLILTLPATDLYGEDRLPVEAARRKADFLAARLGQLQKVLKIRVPVYVLITKADSIPGFVQFCGAFSAAHREQIFGWSSPHPPELPYAPDWIDESFGEIYRTQNLLLLDLLASGKISPQERDAAFLFPRNVRSLAEPLRVFFDQLFRSSVYSEPALFRGFYLCGDATVKGVMARAEEEGGEGAPRQPSFLPHLFAKKIFPEHSLAQPLRSSLASIGVMVNLARGALGLLALVGLVALSSAYARLSRDADTLRDFLERIPTKVGPTSQADRDVAQDTQLLLRAMANVSSNKLRRAALPTSLFSDIDEEVRGLMKDSFEMVVLSGMRHGLNQKARKLFGSDVESAPKVRGRSAGGRGGVSLTGPGAGIAAPRPGPAGPGEIDEEDDQDLAPLTPSGGSATKKGAARAAKVVQIPPVQAFASMQEFLDLQDLAKAYLDFTRNVDTYNRLGSDRRKKMDTVAPLVKYIFEVDLGETFKLDAALYQEALESASYAGFDLRLIAPRVEARAREITESLHRRLFLENPVEVEISEILRSINRLQTEGQWDGADKQTLEGLRDLIQQLASDLDRSELSWLARETLDLGLPYQEMLLTLNRISAEGRGSLGDEVQRTWQESFRRLRGAILDQKAPEMGPLVESAQKGKLALSLTKPAMDVKVALDGFLGQNYVLLADREVVTRNEGTSYRVNWNEDLLRQAIQLSDIYTVFVRDRLGQIYPAIRGSVKATAKEMLGRSMPALISSARRSERIANNNAVSQDEVAAEVSDLKRVSPLLRQVLDTYEKVGLSTAYADFARQVREDSRQILTRLDVLFDKEEMYRTSRKLSRWQGQRAPALVAFDVEDPEALAQYVKTQRTRMKSWARDFAATPVTLLEGLPGGDADAQMARWKGIVRELESFEKMTPNNSVKELETLIEATMITLSPDNCVDRLPRRTVDRLDYFQQQHARIYSEMRKRCLELSEERLRDDFKRLGEQFKRDLEGRFPFTRRRARSDDEDADPRDVRAFYLAFDDYDKKYHAYRNHPNVELQPGMLETARKIEGFLDSARAVRPFFAPLIADKSGDTVPRYNLGVDFRVNRDKEINGNQIAEWTLSVADQRVDEPQAVWQLGDKIRVSLRWAKDGLYRPASAGQMRGAQIDGDQVTYEWGGQWALLRFLRYHLSQETDLGRLDVQPHILKFPVQIEERKKSGRVRLLPDEYYLRKGVPVGSQTRNAYISTKAVAFVRFRVSLPDSKDFIIFRPSLDWPAEAPSLDTK